MNYVIARDHCTSECVLHIFVLYVFKVKWLDARNMNVVWAHSQQLHQWHRVQCVGSVHRQTGGGVFHSFLFVMKHFIGASLTFVQSVSVTASHLHITLYFFPFPLYCIQHCKELLLWRFSRRRRLPVESKVGASLFAILFRATDLCPGAVGEDQL